MMQTLIRRCWEVCVLRFDPEIVSCVDDIIAMELHLLSLVVIMQRNNPLARLLQIFGAAAFIRHTSSSDTNSLTT